MPNIMSNNKNKVKQNQYNFFLFLFSLNKQKIVNFLSLNAWKLLPNEMQSDKV